MDAAGYDRIGEDVRINYKNISVAGGYITGENHESGADKDIWFAEGYYFVFPWMIPYARYESMNVRQPAPRQGDQARFILGAATLLRANIRLKIEGRIYTTNEPAEINGGNKQDGDRIAFLLDWAF